MNDLARRSGAGGLTEKQQAFVSAVLSGAEEKDALTLAGYSETTDPASVLGSRAVQNAIQVGCDARLRGPLLAKALRTIEELLDKSTPSATRFQAAKFVAERQKVGEEGDKALSEMTEDELMAVIEKAQKAVNDAKDPRLIDVTPGNRAQQQGTPTPSH